MYYRLFLVPALLTFCTGESLARGRPDNIFAFEGGDVILPCSFNITASSDFPTVEWSKEGLKPNVVFLYRDGCETYEMKNQAFEYRTSLMPKELKNGNISLRISNVQLSDAGRYQCMWLWRNAPRGITTVELVVGAASEPKLSVVSVECGGLTLQCEAKYWLPEPEIMFLDDRGNIIPAEEPKREKDASGNCTMSRRITLHSATNSITCRVHHPKFNMARRTEIHLPAGFMRSCFLTSIITVGGTVLVLVLVCGVAVCVWKRCGKSVKTQTWTVNRNPSDQSIFSFQAKGLLETDASVVNTRSDHLQKEVDLLKLDHSRKPIISTHNNPPECTSLTQNKGPKPGIQRENNNQPLQRNHCTNSSPTHLAHNKAPKTSSSSAICSKKIQRQLEHVGCSCTTPSQTSSQTSLSVSVINPGY